MKSNYFEKLKPEVKEYFAILAEEIPDFLIEYIETPAVQRIAKTGMCCGTDHTNLFHNKFFYSNLEHSIGVALIVWNFTKDKKQTLAGLFHDIATPAFKHCIDFLHKDYETQESTEELTTKLIQDSKEIMQLLQRDGITLQEVEDYKMYPIADNETPRLSADRLEYNFSSGIVFGKIWGLQEIEEFYNNIIVLENEDRIPELGFKDIAVAEKFVVLASKMWPQWICNKDKITMQFFADIIKEMIEHDYLTEQDLYELSELEVISKIKDDSNEKIAIEYKAFEKAEEIIESEEVIPNAYCRSVKAKRRYIIPLVTTKQGAKRINEVSNIAKEKIEAYMTYKTTKYVAISLE